jgi:anti-sigma factor RsiW
MHRDPSPPVTDDELSASVDGELAPARRDAVDAWLRTHPDDAARVAAWRRDREALQATFAGPAPEPVPAELRALVWRRGTPRWARASTRAAALAAALGLGMLLGGGAVWQWQRQQAAQWAAGTPQGWMQRAAFAHSVYVPEPRHAVEVKAQEEHLARWLTRRIEVPVKLFDLRALGFDLVGGRLLPDGPGKSAQLMYQDAAGNRVTVYLRKPEQGADAAFRYERHGELGLFYWVEDGAGYALVGALPRERLLALAEAIYRQGPSPAGTP